MVKTWRTRSRLRAARERAGMTQQQLATAVGSSHAVIYQWESRGVDPHFAAASRVWTALRHVLDSGQDVLWLWQLDQEDNVSS
jgi:DNA-binding XRE family transcriptional regulator